MSSFIIRARHKEKNTLHTVSCIDDYFGRREYGYIVDRGDALREPAFYAQYSPEDETDSNDGKTS